MILLKRAIPFLSSIAILVFGEMLMRFSAGFWYLVAIGIVLHIAAFAYLLSQHAERRDTIFFFAVASVLLASTTFFLIFLSDQLLMHGLLVLTAFLYGWYAENIFHYLYQPQRYQPYSLEHISTYINLLSFFTFFCGLFAARIFLNITLPTMITFGSLTLILLSFQSSWGNKLREADAMLHTLVNIYIMIEFLGIVILLPTSIFVSALLLTVPYYLMASLSRHAVRGTLKRGVLVRYISIGLTTFILTLLTAPWS